MDEEKNGPNRIIRVGGREFKLYETIDKESGDLLLDLPNFDEIPEYTNDGKPFALRVRDECPHGKSRTPEGLDGDCATCVWFHQETPFDPIGVCMCESRKIAAIGNSPDIKKFLSRHRFPAAIICLLAVAMLFIPRIIGPGNEGIFIENEQVPLAAFSLLLPDENAKQYMGVEPDVINTQGIKIIGYTAVAINVDSAEIQMLLLNPEDNFYHFVFEITVEEKPLYASGLVAPGMCIESISLSDSLPYGEYKAALIIRAYAVDSLAKISDARVDFIFYVT